MEDPRAVDVGNRKDGPPGQESVTNWKQSLSEQPDPQHMRGEANENLTKSHQRRTELDAGSGTAEGKWGGVDVDEETGLDRDIARGLADLGLYDDAIDSESEDDDGLAAGVIANKENKDLDRQVKAHEKLLSEYEDQLEENTTRVGIMTDHLKNVEQELLHTQSLVDTKMKEIETEKHLKRMAEIEISRMESMNKEALQKIEKTEEALNIIQGEQYASGEKLEKFKMQMNWNQEELLQWSLAAKQKDEDRMAVERYKLEDDKRIHQLALTKEKLTKQMQQKKQALENEVTETQAVQIELNKTADEYRNTHDGRQQLIKQWNDAVEAMQRRDEDIRRAKEAVAKAQAELREKAKIVRGKKRFLEQEQVNNQEVQVKIDSKKRAVEKSRLELQKTKGTLVELEDELAALRNELLEAQAEVHRAEEENARLKGAADTKASLRSKIAATLEERKREMEFFIAKTEDMAERSKRVQLLHEQHKEELAQKFRELATMKNSLFKENEQLATIKRQRKNYATEISSAQRASKMLQAKIHDLDRLSLKQQEMLYNTEFQVQQMERKVDRASGKRSYEETEALNKLIGELKEQMELHDKTRQHMVNQVKRLDTEVKTAERESIVMKQMNAKLSEKLHNIELESLSLEREFKAASKMARDLTMEHDVLKLEVTKLKSRMADNSQKIFGLRSHKMELELQMKGRRDELKLHKEIQKGELKAAEDARHQIAVDLKERQLKAKKLQQKYDTIHAKLKSEDGEEKTQAYYIIKVAQEREELQSKGDKLNDNIKTAEKDIKMLTKALMKLNKRNDKYKSMLYKADANGPDYQLKEKLEEQHRSVSDALYTKKSHLNEIKAEYEESKQILTATTNEIGRLRNEIKAETKEQKTLSKVLMQQDAQRERVSSELGATTQQLKKAFGKTKGVDEYVEYLCLKQKK
mmetsp:Transcript_15568/g.31560  ORF Transcript_15568/g.31560 Transcript_15568/m.31560 type:complete len:925 (-) Transcript_15568:400-3174(-)